MKSLIICFLCFFLSLTYAQKKHVPPNVILILVDDMGYGEITSHGNKQIHTPHLDRLSADGISFTDFHVNAVCSPSRAALLTGRYASHTGVWHTLGYNHLLNIDEKILPEYFKEVGYQTYMVGKWHLGDTAPYTPESRGFDRVFRIGGGGLGQLPDYWGNGLYDGHYFDGENWLASEGFSTDVQFKQAKKFINEASNKPFFLYLATTAPHTPVGAPHKYVKPYLDLGLKKSVAQFYGMVTNIDENVGGLRSFLSQNNLLDNTIILFMSDNGSANDKKGSAYNAGMKGKKGSLFEGGHRVPCFAYWPRGNWTGGKKLDHLTAHIDWLPTLANICHFKTDNLNIHGEDLSPLIKEETDSIFSDRILVAENKINNRGKGMLNAVVMRQKTRWVSGKYFYDIKTDPSQQIPLNIKKNLKDAYQAFYHSWFAQMKHSNQHQKLLTVAADKTTVLDGMTMEMYDGAKQIWNQKAVLKGQKVKGFWKVKVQESGRYQLDLLRTPSYVKLPINNLNLKKAKHWKVTKASIQINGEQVAEQPLKEGVSKVSFELPLQKGNQEIAAFFWENNQAFSVNFLEFKKIKSD